jgi:hypothetical protein
MRRLFEGNAKDRRRLVDDYFVTDQFDANITQLDATTHRENATGEGPTASLTLTDAPTRD